MAEAAIVDFQLAEIARACGAGLLLACALLCVIVLIRRY